jgi:hypothetical protein
MARDPRFPCTDKELHLLIRGRREIDWDCANEDRGNEHGSSRSSHRVSPCETWRCCPKGFSSFREASIHMSSLFACAEI